MNPNQRQQVTVRLDQIFDEYKDTVFPCPGIVFHDQWDCPMTI